MKRIALPLLSLLTLALPLAAENGAPLHKKEVLSKVYTIDKIYKSMEGPNEQQRITLGNSDRPELLWVKSVRVDIVGEDGKTPAPSEFMCHMNIDLDPAKHQALLATPYPASTRLLTLSQGVFEGKVPEGYGYPVVSTEPLIVFTQVLNHNIANPGNVKVRHRVTIEYMIDSPRDANGVMTTAVEITKIELLGASDVAGLTLAPPKPVASLR